jgi:hypothetical protein
MYLALSFFFPTPFYNNNNKTKVHFPPSLVSSNKNPQPLAFSLFLHAKTTIT